MPPSPIGYYPELAQAYASSFDRLGRQTQQAGDEFNTGVQTEAQAAQRKSDLEARAQRLQDMTDPNKYQKIKKDDGGFDFIDPQGQQVDIATLAQRTGTKAIDWIKDSENPIDVQYLNDYSNLQDFMNAVLSKDKKKRDSFISTDKNLQRYTQGRGGIDRLLRDFKMSYQRYYTPRSINPQAWGQAPGRVVVPTAQSNEGYGLGGGGEGI